ncbi:hypothetical protein HYH02_009792 [Chlamydomonas schloesseri]|uniref:Proteasome inhibitor PI31 subunit n=1 Tax=Chlamydomonas schloesseri TaxID=2026947 RepID=A0A835W771_9CHLO|nr:hypothetical protein HYH02_009792 [Chlamydomonas schloesseri]|eukprot:KAG2442000.1 hypothetical protein HYH02_009792 [Chlamydomonas schloesseri]
MATPQAVTAVIRASRPEFRSAADRLAFAVHAVVSVNGFSLRKVGDVAVDEAVAAGPSALPSDECGLEGWNHVGQGQGAGHGAGQDVGSAPATYAFLYVPDSPGMERQDKASPPPLLLVKCLSLDAEGAAADGAGTGAVASAGVLLVSLADAATGRPPVTLELPVARYVSPGGTYDKMDELISRVTGALEEALEVPAAASRAGAKASAASTATTASAAGKTAGASQGQPQPQPQRGREHPETEPDHDPLRDDRYRGPPRGPPGYGMGSEDDRMPGGVPRPPGMGGGLMLPGGGGGGLAGGGGMLVGPDNPIFADRLRHPRMGGPGMGGPGMGPGGPGVRWDPIAPEGLQGWHPDDFTREGRAHRGEGFNDIGRPPPGRGPDWDNMFG